MTQSQSAAPAGPQITHSRLANGMEIVTIPDRRAPVVTHMVWYRNGSADDPPCKSGIAHFLEHLMFKGTKAHPAGEISEKLAEFGGQENAFTSYDYTAYFQRAPREHLPFLMEYEADRMVNLTLTDEVVTPERDVVLEERRMHADSDPAAQLSEAVHSALFSRHPYGTPVIGWAHEIATLDRTDALAYYNRFYTPENAILIVAGDVDHTEVEALARDIYGKIPARGEAPKRVRQKEPPCQAHRQVTLTDPKVEQPACERVFLVPSARSAAPGESEALEVATHILGASQTSRLYRSLVVEKKIAVTAGGYYMSGALDDSRLWIYAMPAAGVSLEELDAAVGAELAAFKSAPPSARELARAKTRLIADAVYAQDSQTSLARWYGAALATGETVEEVAGWSARIDAVTAEQACEVARKYLTDKRSVTGFLKPEPQTEAA